MGLSLLPKLNLDKWSLCYVIMKLQYSLNTDMNCFVFKFSFQRIFVYREKFKKIEFGHKHLHAQKW